MIRFACSNCNKKLGIADSEGGKAVKCPQCGTKVRIPPAETSSKQSATEKPPPKHREAEAETEELSGFGGGEEFVDADPVEEQPRRRKPVRRSQDEDETLNEDEEPHRPQTKKKSRRQDEDEEEDDYDDEEKGAFSANRLRGVVAVLVAGGVLAFALLFPRLQEEEYEIHKWIGCGLAGVIFLAGLFYLIKG